MKVRCTNVRCDNATDTDRRNADPKAGSGTGEHGSKRISVSEVDAAFTGRPPALLWVGCVRAVAVAAVTATNTTATATGAGTRERPGPRTSFRRPRPTPAAPRRPE